MHEYENPFVLKADKPLTTEKLQESIESYRFVSQRARMSGQFDQTKASNICKVKL